MNINITVADLLSELYCYRKLFSTFPLIRIENPTRTWSKQRIIHITVVSNEFPRVALWKLMHRRPLLNGAWHSNVLNFPVLSLTLSRACCSSLATDVHTDTSARFSHLQAGANELSQSPICLHQPRWLSVETEPSCSPSFMSLFSPLTSFFALSFCYLPVAHPHPPTHSVYSFITLYFPSCLHPLSLSHSLHLSPLSRSFLKLPEVPEPAARAKPFGPFSQTPLSFCFSFLFIQPSETPNPLPRMWGR